MIAEMPKTAQKLPAQKKNKSASSSEMQVSTQGGHDRTVSQESVELDEAKFVEFPNSPYRLYQPFPPAGDQPEAIRQLCEGIEDGLLFQRKRQ